MTTDQDLNPDYQSSPATTKDMNIMQEQLGRKMRDVAAIGARTSDGEPMVVITVPRLANGEPFPTTFYLTHPELTSAVSSLEAAGFMYELSDRLAQEPDLQKQYQRAHDIYLAARNRLADHYGMDPIPEIENITAGGMPTRVKCLHALVAQSLTFGPGVNPLGDIVLEQLNLEF